MALLETLRGKLRRRPAEELDYQEAEDEAEFKRKLRATKKEAYRESLLKAEQEKSRKSAEFRASGGFFGAVARRIQERPAPKRQKTRIVYAKTSKKKSKNRVIYRTSKPQKKKSGGFFDLGGGKGGGGFTL